MALRVGESGKPFRYWTKFDMSEFTELELKFTAPDGGQTTFNTGTTEAVALGTVDVYDPDIDAVLEANEYMVLEFPSSLFDEDGFWKVQGTYTNTGETPDDIIIGPNKKFKVEAVA